MKRASALALFLHFYTELTFEYKTTERTLESFDICNEACLPSQVKRKRLCPHSQTMVWLKSLLRRTKTLPKELIKNWNGIKEFSSFVIKRFWATNFMILDKCRSELEQPVWLFIRRKKSNYRLRATFILLWRWNIKGNYLAKLSRYSTFNSTKCSRQSSLTIQLACQLIWNSKL